MSSSPSTVDDTDRKLTESPTNLSQAQRDFEIIPETHNNRTLVLCFDGTGDKFDSDVRNPTLNVFPYHHLPHHRIMAEFQRRPVYITPQEGQQARTNGLLSGTSTGSPYGTTLTLGTEDWNRYIHLKTRPRFFHPNGQEDVKITGRGCRLEPCKSHPVFVLD